MRQLTLPFLKSGATREPDAGKEKKKSPCNLQAVSKVSKKRKIKKGDKDKVKRSRAQLWKRFGVAVPTSDTESRTSNSHEGQDKDNIPQISSSSKRICNRGRRILSTRSSNKPQSARRNRRQKNDSNRNEMSAAAATDPGKIENPSCSEQVSESSLGPKEHGSDRTSKLLGKEDENKKIARDNRDDHQNGQSKKLDKECSRKTPTLSDDPKQIYSEGYQNSNNKRGIEEKKVERNEEQRKLVGKKMKESSISEYEKQRLDNIKKNLEFLAQLGIEEKHFQNGKKIKNCNRKKKSRNTNIPPSQPLRRSSRRRGIPPDVSKATQQAATNEEYEEEELIFDDSSVLKYKCLDTQIQSTGKELEYRREKKDCGPFTGVRRLNGDSFFDPNLSKIYAVDIIKLGQKLLMAAAGDKGNVAIYGIESTLCNAAASNSENRRVDDGSILEGNSNKEALLAFRAHQRWIGGMKFLTQQSSQSDCPLLITASDDGGVILWDISKQAASRKGVQARSVHSTYELHNAGIFSLDTRDTVVVTGSKDKSISWAKIRESGLQQLASLEYHSSVVKTTCIRDSNTIASAGNDRDICIWDARGGKASIIIEDAHQFSINAVQWHPYNENLIVSAALDPFLHLHDIRHPKKPLYSFTGHALPRKSKAMYQPIFLRTGMNITSEETAPILTGGRGTECLSLYSPSTGNVISRGESDIDYTTLGAYHGSDGNSTILIAGASRKHLHLFTPVIS